MLGFDVPTGATDDVAGIEAEVPTSSQSRFRSKQLRLRASFTNITRASHDAPVVAAIPAKGTFPDRPSPESVLTRHSYRNNICNKATNKGARLTSFHNNHNSSQRSAS